MSSKKFMSAIAAVALMASSSMAAAQVAPAPEAVEGSELRGEGSGVGQIFPLIAIIAIVFLIREIVKDRDIGENPISP